LGHSVRSDRGFYVYGLVTLTSIIILSWPGFNLAFGDDSDDYSPRTKTRLPEAVESGLTHLISLIADPSQKLDPERIQSLIEYNQVSEGDDFSVQPRLRHGGASAYLRFEVDAPLDSILRYAFNPNIPKFLIFPNLLRLSGWQTDSEILKRPVLLADELKDLNQPLLLRGQEYEVSSPDPSVNTYFRYDVDRLLLLMNHKKGKVFISVSESVGPSEVGKKAVIIDDDNWNYFYSGITGVNKRLIGWVEAHLYHRASVFVYFQPLNRSARTKVLLFNWVKAGWKGINVVKDKHINEGCLRYAESLKNIVETAYLPTENHLAQSLKMIQDMDNASIDAKIRQYAINFERIARPHEGMSNTAFSQIIADGGYSKLFTKQERIGILQLEFFKSQIGKPCLVEFDGTRLNSRSLAYKHNLNSAD
jgi:hypothetical protein